MKFEWDDRKADTNRIKHRVSFQEAETVFYDTFSVTFDDPDHSDDEPRFIIIGTSNRGRVLMVAHTDRGDRIRIISARVLKPKERRLYESGTYVSLDDDDDDDLRDEYDETLLKNGVRGKYIQRLMDGALLVRLAPDVAAAFPTEEAVNTALRLLLQVAKQTAQQAA